MKIFSPLFAIVALTACSILEGDEITTQQDFDKLSLKKITFIQNQNGTQTSNPIAITDSAMDVTFSEGRLTLQKRFNWPDVSPDSKLQFRSGITNSINVRLRYFDTGKIRSCFIYSAGKLREAYWFYYKSTGNLRGLLTRNYSSEGATTISTYDSLNWGTLGVGPVFRFPQGSPQEQFYINQSLTNRCLGSLHYVFKEKEYNHCGSDNFFIYPGGQVATLYSVNNGHVMEFFMGEKRANGDTDCCGDTYYFHPIFFEDVGMQVLLLYAPDYWKTATGSMSDKTESVQLKFNYE